MYDPNDKRFQLRILNTLWYSVLGGPLVLALMVLAIPYGPIVEWLPRQALWNVSLVALAFLLASGRAFTRQRLEPDRVAAGAKPWKELEDGNVEGDAYVRVMFASVRAAALLDIIPFVVLVLAILHAQPLLALVDGVLALVAAAVAKPDFVNALLATESRLRRS